MNLSVLTPSFSLTSLSVIIRALGVKYPQKLRDGRNMFGNIMGWGGDEAALVVAIHIEILPPMPMSLRRSQELGIELGPASLSNINLFVDIEISADFAVVQHFSSCQRILYSLYFQSRTNDTLWITSKTSKGWQKMKVHSSTTLWWTRTPVGSTSEQSTSFISSLQTWNPR